MSSPSSFLASGGSRSFAYVVDLCASAIPLIPAAYATYIAGTPSAGALEFSLLLLAYHVYYLYFREGRSLGKFFQNITVVRPDGAALQPLQCFIRAGLLATPWALIGINDRIHTQPGGDQPLALLAVSWLLVEAALIHYAPTRRGIADRLANTLVVKLPPPQPHRAPAVPMFSGNDAEFGTPPKEALIYPGSPRWSGGRRPETMVA
jgi:uncharacterized RDD family membrane protein YckC